MAEVILRVPAPDEAEVVHRLLRDLAEAVGELHHFTAAVEDVARDAFGSQRRYETLLALAEGRPAGLATWFLTYSTYKGRPAFYVNDLYVPPWARGLGVARRLMSELAGQALAADCCRLELRVLDGNPAQDFYGRIGLAANREVTYLAAGADLRALAEEKP